MKHEDIGFGKSARFQETAKEMGSGKHEPEDVNRNIGARNGRQFL